MKSAIFKSVCITLSIITISLLTPFNGHAQYDGSYDSGYDGSYDSGYDGSYDSGYDGSYDSGYDGSYDSGYDGSYDSSYYPTPVYSYPTPVYSYPTPPSPPPTVDLKVNGVDGTSGLDNNSTVNLSWTTTNSPDSCTLYLLTGVWTQLSTGLPSVGSATTIPLPGPATYYFGMTCSNSAGTSSLDYVPVGVNAIPAQSCPTTCHTDIQYVPDGSGGQTTCPSNAPAAQSCPTTCHTDIQSVPNGSCGQTTCSANNTSPDYAYQAPPACNTSPVILRNGQCSTYNYSANCVGDGATCQGSTCVIKPTVDLYINFSVSPIPVPDGNNVIVTWGNTNSPTSTCSASSTDNVWSGTKDNAGGGDIAGPLSGSTGGKTYTFTLTCSNAAAPLGITKSVSILVYAPVSGSCSVFPTSAKTGDTVIWNTSGVSGGIGSYTYSWSGDENLTGTNSSVTKSYSSQGSKSGSVIVTSGSQSTTLSCPNLSVQNPSCNTGTSCGGCTGALNTCSTTATTQSCTYTAYSLGGPCNQAAAPDQSCTYNNCSQGYVCSTSGSCQPVPGSFSLNTPSTSCSSANQAYVDLSWTVSSNATSYAVYRWNFSTSQYDWLGSNLSGTNTFWRDYPPNSGSTQIYTVLAVNDYGSIAPTNTDVRPSTSSCPAATANIKCIGSDGIATDGTATIDNNTSATISWSSTNATSCSASGSGISSTATSNTGTATGNLTGPNSYTYSLSCSNSYSTSLPDSCYVDVSAQPNCTDTIVCDQTCNLSPNQTNTCSQNGTKSCRYTGPGTCTQVPAPSQTCDYPNCSGGYNCSISGTCVPNVIAPTVNITASAVTIDNGQAVTLSWTTTNNPTSCTATADPASSIWTGDPGHEAINSRSTGSLTGPAAYTYSIYCTNTAGDSVTDSVTVAVNGPPAIPILEQAGLSASSTQFEPMVAAPGSNVTCTINGPASLEQGTTGTYTVSPPVPSHCVGNPVEICYYTTGTGAAAGYLNPLVYAPATNSSFTVGAVPDTESSSQMTLRVYISTPTYTGPLLYGYCLPPGCPLGATGSCNTTKTITITPPNLFSYPDLVVTDLSPVNKLFLPGNITFSGKVKNNSSGTTALSTAAASKAQLFIDYNRDGTINYQSSKADVPILAPGASSPALPWDKNDIPPGIHVYAICADVDSQVTEKNSTPATATNLNPGENNNCTVASFAVAPPPTSFSMGPSFTACSNAQPYVDVFWTPSAENTTHYALFKFHQPPGGTVALQDAIVFSVSDPRLSVVNNNINYRDTNVLSGNSYNYAVLAYNATYGTYAWSNITPMSPPTPTEDASAGFIQAASCPSPFTISADAFCNGINPRVSISSNGSSNAQSYEIYRYHPSTNWIYLPPNTLGFPVNDDTAENVTDYQYTTVAVNQYGRTRSNDFPLTTPSCNPPTITSLEIKNAGNTTFAGSNVSGRQNTQQGSDWFNPIQITLTAERGSSDIKESYVTFTPGFQVAYTPDAGRISGCNGNYCVNDNGWKNIPSEGYPICVNNDCTNSLLLKVFPETIANSWRVLFDKNFGSQPNIPITARVVDQNGLSTSQLNCETTNQLGQCQLIINRNTIP